MLHRDPARRRTGRRPWISVRVKGQQGPSCVSNAANQPGEPAAGSSPSHTLGLGARRRRPMWSIQCCGVKRAGGGSKKARLCSAPTGVRLGKNGRADCSGTGPNPLGHEGASWQSPVHVSRQLEITRAAAAGGRISNDSPCLGPGSGRIARAAAQLAGPAYLHAFKTSAPKSSTCFVRRIWQAYVQCLQQPSGLTRSRLALVLQRSFPSRNLLRILNEAMESRCKGGLLA